MTKQKLRTFLQPYRNYGTKNVAGFLDADGETFHYLEQTNPCLPAAVNVYEQLGLKGPVYSNLPKDHWLRFYKKQQTNIKQRNAGGDALDTEVTPQKIRAPHTPPHLAIPTADAPLPGGGIYRAAEHIKNKAKLKEGTPEHATMRALRYYMLACFVMLDLRGTFDSANKSNWVAAMMVSDTGKILAMGLNNGGYRHAEVSMLHAYFTANPTSSKLPPKTVVFSTLTPCGQCAGYLTDAKADDTLIYFGQADPGPAGKMGAAISQQLALQQQPVKAHLTDDEKKELLKVAGITEDQAGEGVVVSAGKGDIFKVSIGLGLSPCTAAVGQSAATAVSASRPSRMLIAGATRAFDNKMAKDRSKDPEAEIKVAVLRYLTEVLVTLDL